MQQQQQPGQDTIIYCIHTGAHLAYTRLYYIIYTRREQQPHASSDIYRENKASCSLLTAALPRNDARGNLYDARGLSFGAESVASFVQISSRSCYMRNLCDLRGLTSDKKIYDYHARLSFFTDSLVATFFTSIYLYTSKSSSHVRSALGRADAQTRDSRLAVIAARSNDNYVCVHAHSHSLTPPARARANVASPPPLQKGSRVINSLYARAAAQQQQRRRRRREEVEEEEEEESFRTNIASSMSKLKVSGVPIAKIIVLTNKMASRVVVQHEAVAATWRRKKDGCVGSTASYARHHRRGHTRASYHLFIHTSAHTHTYNGVHQKRIDKTILCVCCNASSWSHARATPAKLARYQYSECVMIIRSCIGSSNSFRSSHRTAYTIIIQPRRVLKCSRVLRGSFAPLRRNVHRAPLRKSFIKCRVVNTRYTCQCILYYYNVSRYRN
ncbi:unnamed protein product [Trichogramma brassicae]|uniref:Uncharacterized protein n=1 Tax=Trichogramma brassicae TaxID=86971 RepID=A0A6H5HVG1_9HYME|nr:unnamed protein product [Trichogramma brassicae]